MDKQRLSLEIFSRRWHETNVQTHARPYDKNVDEEQMMRLNGQFENRCASRNADTDLICNVGIGTGRENERAAALQQDTYSSKYTRLWA